MFVVLDKDILSMGRSRSRDREGSLSSTGSGRTARSKKWVGQNEEWKKNEDWCLIRTVKRDIVYIYQIYLLVLVNMKLRNSFVLMEN